MISCLQKRELINKIVVLFFFSDVALDDKLDDEILMIHKMPPELASKIKSLDAETLQKISSVPPKIWEKLKQLPLEAFDAMLELKASD